MGLVSLYPVLAFYADKVGLAMDIMGTPSYEGVPTWLSEAGERGRPAGRNRHLPGLPGITGPSDRFTKDRMGPGR